MSKVTVTFTEIQLKEVLNILTRVEDALENVELIQDVDWIYSMLNKLR